MRLPLTHHEILDAGHSGTNKLLDRCLNKLYEPTQHMWEALDFVAKGGEAA